MDSSSGGGSSSSGDSLVKTGSFGAFLTVLIINICLFIIIFLAFWILRTRKSNEFFFAPRLFHSDGSVNKNIPDPGRGIISWILPVIHFSEEELFQTQSLDGVMYYKIQKLLTLIFPYYIPIGVAVLIPINFTAEGNIKGVPQLSMSNVPSSDSRLWAHSSCCVIFTFFTLFLMYRLYFEYTELRVRWMKRNEAHNFSVLFTGVPKKQIKEEGVENIFHNMFPGEVVSAHFAEDNPILRDYISEWETTDTDLFFAREANQTSHVRPTHKTTPVIGTEVDSIDFYSDKTAMLSRHISSHKAAIKKDPKPTKVVFVTYKTIGYAFRASQLCISSSSGRFLAQPAPHEKDVFWEMYARPQWRKAVMTPLLYAIAILMIIFWSAIIVFAQGIVNLPALARTPEFSFLRPVLNWDPIVIGFISGYLPALVVIIATALLPTILRLLVEMAGVETHSQSRRRVMRLYFLFLLVNVFLVTVIAGGALTVIDKLVTGPVSNVLVFLGQSLPAQSIFFINYILVYALFTYPLRILRIGNLIVSRIKRYLARSEAEVKFVERPPPFTYELLYGTQLLMFLIGFAYSIISPFIIPFCFLFFACTYLFGKYTMIYVESPTYDSGGKDWPVFFRRMIVSMVAGQIVMIGVFIFKKSPALILVAFLPFITISFCVLVSRRFNPICSYLPLLEYPHDQEQHIINNNNNSSSSGRNATDYQETYIDPVRRDDLINTILHPSSSSSLDLELGERGGSHSKSRSAEEEDSYEFQHPTELQKSLGGSGGIGGGAHVYSPASRKSNFKQ
eukprot:TRINITY_DN1969_c1_g1_i1.p1 TRINITY_DN1969_c1_g1~~TRINITY_DN1969_c1_g1_i1.p1  ORF type:complete len:788 (+),score=207.44 TRINITY_DN1969_c1_g1_i1:116-2479(+)